MNENKMAAECLSSGQAAKNPDTASGKTTEKPDTLLCEGISEQAVKALDDALYRNNTEQLKKQMIKLFTFKKIFNMHEDHIAQLAESIIDAYHDDDRLAWAKRTDIYARGQINKYQVRKKKVIAENQWAKAAGNINKVKKLDLTYRLWVYEAGFEYSKYQMYTMLLSIIRDIEEYERKKKY